MLPIESLSNMFPLIVTPAYDCKLFCNYALSLLRFQVEAQRLGFMLQVEMPQGHSLITRARNDMVAHFLSNRQWTHLFWIDADVGFSPEAAIRLLRSDYDVAVGAYPLKREYWPETGLPAGLTRQEFLAHYMRYPLNLTICSDADKYVLEIQPDGFFEVEEAATGFMLIKRRVFEAMINHYPELAYEEVDPLTQQRSPRYRFFDAMVDPRSKRYMSEDYTFCHLWKKMGGTIYMDGRSNLNHQGTKIYEGNFANSLLRSPDQSLPRKKGLPLEIRGVEYLYSEKPAVENTDSKPIKSVTD